MTSFHVHNIKKFDNTGEDLEDLISIGTIGLIKAIESFQDGEDDRTYPDATNTVPSKEAASSLQAEMKPAMVGSDR